MIINRIYRMIHPAIFRDVHSDDILISMMINMMIYTHYGDDDIIKYGSQHSDCYFLWVTTICGGRQFI